MTVDRIVLAVKTFMVETYLPRTRSSELTEMAIRLSSPDGIGWRGATGVRYLRSTYVPEDEICFHIFEAETVEAVRKASVRAALVFDRILEAEESRP